VRFTTHGVNLLVLVAVVLACLDLVGVQTTSIVALIGAAGLAIGLAMQGSLANFAAGMLIIFFRPFRVGDFIAAADTSGTVEEISIFTTHLCTPDNRSVIVPNARITNGNIVNHTARDRRRIELKVCIGYDADVQAARSIIESVLTSEPRILSEPKPVVGLMTLGETSVELAVWMWVRLKDELEVKFAVNEALKRELEHGGCAIQYQTRVVRLVPIAEKSA
jgi:small conductance mechanosensitive channel